jgi:crotonobetainyl-CoA:carnitine CoA-transferase CaiB-like acyl-CoA transferase
MRVLDLSEGVPGGYASLLLTWTGADVVRGEPAGGDPMRRWRHGDEPTDGDGPLFEYLRQGESAVRADLAELDARRLLALGADVVLASPTDEAQRATLRAAAEQDPGLIVVAITPYGMEGPYADRAATDFTLQADSGALAIRGVDGEEPYQMGGRTSEWLAGSYVAAVALSLWRGRRAGGPGGLVDLSRCEVNNVGASNYLDVFHAVANGPDAPPEGAIRNPELPSIERTADGWVGFNTNAPHMIAGFLRMLGRDDLAEGGEWMLIGSRVQRADEWHEIADGWLAEHATDDVIEQAVGNGVPVAPVCDGRTVVELGHAETRGAHVPSPSGRGLQPRRPWKLDGELAPPPDPAPALVSDEHTEPPWRGPAGDHAVTRPELAGRPLDGLRVLDLTAWWAGPAATALYAALGADVIHVEGPGRMDGVRMVGASIPGREQWWELSNFFLTVNLNKRDLVLDLTSDAGRDLLLRLVGEADVVVENFTPKVLDKLGIGWDAVHAANPRAVLVRMPAYGLDGPWRERPGFAQTIEQASGLAWITGHRGDQPRIQRGPCDPNGGMHAVIASLCALEQREATGEGSLVESAMFDAALAVAAEPVLEWTTYGTVLGRDGNRSPWAAPQGLYETVGSTSLREGWLAVSVADDQQWQALTEVLERPDLAEDPELAALAGRRQHHDRLDEAVASWAAARTLEEAVDLLAAAGVPAAPAIDPQSVPVAQPQLAARGFYEQVAHPVAGTLPIPTLPFRLTGVERWTRTPAPCFGEHNAEILTGLLGLDADELAQLAADGVIADRPTGT